jgi:hypothetical protein
MRFCCGLHSSSFDPRRHEHQRTPRAFVRALLSPLFEEKEVHFIGMTSDEAYDARQATEHDYLSLGDDFLLLRTGF